MESAPSSSQDQDDDDLPECPVCLQPFDPVSAVPRVLPCGHSICHVCLPLLPPPLSSLPNSLRCPSCTQLVPFDRQVGPASLPKNLDLLHFVCPNGDKPSSRTRAEVSASRVAEVSAQKPLLWPHQNLLSFWKNFVLPENLVILGGNGDGGIKFGTFGATIGSPWFCKEKQRISLLQVKAESFVDDKSEWYQASYIYRMMDLIEKLGDKAREELGFLLEASSRVPYGISKAYGLWLDLTGKQGSNLYMVCEGFDRKMEFSSKPADEQSMFQVGVACMEFCEIITNLHSEGISCGCLGFECFYLNKHGHVILSLNEVIVLCRRLREVSFEGDYTSLSDVEILLAPELLTKLHKGPIKEFSTEVSVNYSSDVWCLACLVFTHLTGNMQFGTELMQNLDKDFVQFYEDWKKKVLNKMESVLTGTKFESLMGIIESCLCYEPQKRPHAVNLYRAFQNVLLGSCGEDEVTSCDLLSAKESSNYCLLLSYIHLVDLETRDERGRLEANILDVEAGKRGKDGTAHGGTHDATLIGHRDCVTGLVIGGGFLFSSSYDKTINVWSLQDFSRIQTLRGHEHRIMAIITTDHVSESFCITGDAGSGIFIWKISSPLESEVFKSWYEHNDWRYSGIHSLAFSDSGYLYTGSGDKSIKAWSFQDQSLVCTMTGHKSTVSCLSVRDGILYSGSWDGTVRLWWLSDHTPLCLLGANEVPSNLAPVLSLSSSASLTASTYENGYLKIWRNEMLVRSEKVKAGAIYALYLEQNLIFTGGWDKAVNIQEVSENELEVEISDVASIKCDAIITSLIYWKGKLFVGLSNKEIKVFHMQF
ncbi:Myosin heavy chain kinase A [Rhynchospora pubera]|uniref:Myosin heavy chain kinase A n=1 Tax=Rhynchospora pubera TaxID=906938 RepID=A0AAV8FZK8_9POAL|nr:Myosin heavy chain kinase A [Rhynchospora pubera]